MSFQTNSVYSQNIPSAITLLAARSALGLALLSGAIALLALVISRTLPDGGAIAFLSWRDGNPDIYLLDIVRGTLHNLTDNGAVNGRFTFAPDGTRIAFESNQDGNTEIYMMRVECAGLFSGCGGTRQLTDNATDSRNPVWSPDRRQIAYVYDVSFEDSDNDIYVMDVERGETRNLTDSLADDYSPAWSPDGSRIAFRSNRSGAYEIHIIDPDGSHIQRLTDQLPYSAEYVWSPDGNSIAFTQRTVYVVNVETQALQELIDGDRAADHPTWSPDNRQIAFVYYGECCREILVADRASDDTRPLWVSAQNQSISSLQWSPDGTLLLFELADQSLTDDSRTSRIVILRIGERDVRPLATGNSSYPAWWP